MNLKSIVYNDKGNNKDEKDAIQKSSTETAKVRPILAELGHIPGTGTTKMTLVSPRAVEERSLSAINNSMLLIKEFSRMVGDAMEEIPLEGGPSQVQLGFNILLTTDGKAVITKSEKETNLKVTLTWKHGEQEKE
jgi:hypothetical protein